MRRPTYGHLPHRSASSIKLYCIVSDTDVCERLAQGRFPKWAFTRSDRRTDRSVRLVCPTGRSDDRIV